MTANEAVTERLAERWLELVLASYPAAARTSLTETADPFRNPVGAALGGNLRLLARELLGEMNGEAVASAMDAVVRLRAVQGFSPSAALKFVFDLRRAAAEAGCEIPQARIDELALKGFDQYMSCREQVFALRLKELRSPFALREQVE